jgi:hypothetical protein
MTTLSEPVDYPVTLDGELTEPLSSWLWLVKWLLIPHYLASIFRDFGRAEAVSPLRS